MSEMPAKSGVDFLNTVSIGISELHLTFFFNCKEKVRWGIPDRMGMLAKSKETTDPGSCGVKYEWRLTVTQSVALKTA